MIYDIWIYIYIYDIYDMSRGSYLVQNAIDGVFLPRSLQSRHVFGGLTSFSNAALVFNS